MTRRSQKESEKKAVQRLLERLSLSRATTTDLDARNASPDVGILVDDRFIGVEVTEYNGGPNNSELPKELLYFSLCRELSRLMFSSETMRGIDVELYAANRSTLTKRKVDNAAKQIFDYIASEVVELGDRGKRLQPQHLSGFLRAIRIKRPDHARQYHLPAHSDLHAAWVGVPERSLIDIVRGKARQRRTSQDQGRAFDEYWLLITDGVGFRGSMNSPSRDEFSGFDSLSREVSNSPFSRCYLLCDHSAVFQVTEHGVDQRAPYGSGTWPKLI